MTHTLHTEGRQSLTRALWLAPVPPNPVETLIQRDRAHETAARSGAEVAAEFLYGTSEDGELGDRGWEEALELARMLEIGVIVVLRPDAIARGFTDYYRRTEALEAAGVRLVLPDRYGLPATSAPSGAREAA